jgi:hypothetical protein
MATMDRQHYALQTIFSFFLGLMVVAFIGVAVNTFYPSPESRHESERMAVQREMDQLNMSGKTLDATQTAEMRRIEAKQSQLQQKIEQEMKPWARNTSIILVLFATLVMAVSLVRSEQLRVLSNGLLLGGLFTMLYGTGWVIFSGESTARFIVMAIALLVSIGLGYAKFVRARMATAPAPVATVGAAGAAETLGDLVGLEARVTALEARADAAAAALGGDKAAG